MRIRHGKFTQTIFFVAVLLLTVDQPARADLFGGDDGLLGAILGQAIAQTAKLGEELESLGTQITLMNTMLSRLDGGASRGVSQLLGRTTQNYGALTRDVSAIGYDMAAVDRDFATAFPGRFDGTPSAAFDPAYVRWQSEVLGSALVAARAQGSLAALQANTDQALAIIAASRGASGQVAQLEAVVQMLGVIEGQMNTLISSLVTVGRLQTDVAAASASERQLSREKQRRDLQNYTDRGTPVPVLSTLPEIVAP